METRTGALAGRPAAGSAGREHHPHTWRRTLGLALGVLLTLGALTPAGHAQPIDHETDGQTQAEGPTTWEPKPLILEHPSPVAHATFGVNVVVLDFNQDGRNDVAVGAPGEGDLAGEVYVFFGAHFSSDSAVRITSSLSSAGDRFGSALAAGDLDGDGWDELVIGASEGKAGNLTHAGYASVWRWRGGEPVESHTMGLGQAENGSLFGVSAAVGDFAPAPGLEVAIGQSHRRHPGNGFEAGAVNLYSCRVGLDTEFLGTLWNPNASHDLGRFGARLATGDWNGDGHDDLHTTAIFNDAFDGTEWWPFAGQAFVYEGPIAAGADPSVIVDNPTPWSDPPAGDTASQRFGMHLDAADLDRDGLGEMLVGTPRKDLVWPSVVADAGTGFLYSAASFVPHGGAQRAFLHPTPRPADLTSYRVQFADILGGPELDVVVCLLASFATDNDDEVLIWDGAWALGASASAGPPTRRFQPLADSGPHWPDGIDAGDLDGGHGHEDLVLGDRDYTPPGGPEGIGRVVIYLMP